MQLTFSVEQCSQPQWRVGRAVLRWIRGFGFHSASLALKPAPFTVQVRSDKREFVKGFPAESREEAEVLLERLQAEYASVGLHAFLVEHDAPSRFVMRAANAS